MLSEPNISYKPFWGICRPLNSWRANSPNPIQIYCAEKSVYMIQPFMRITREEAFAIRYHMGFSGSDPVNNVGKAFEMFPLAFALSTADMEATYFLDEQV